MIEWVGEYQWTEVELLNEMIIDENDLIWVDFYGRIEIEWWIDIVWILEMNWWWCWYMEYGVWMIYDEWRDNQDSRFELIESLRCVWLEELIRICDSDLKEKRIGLNVWWLDPVLHCKLIS